MGGGVLLLTLLSIASASYVDYSVDMKVLPVDAYENTNVLVFGYLSIDDLGAVVSPSALSMKVFKGSTVKYSYDYTQLNYYSDYDDSTNLLSGFFYKEISGLTDGKYTVILYIDGEPKSAKIINVLDGESNLTLNLQGVAQGVDSIRPIISVDYNGTSAVVDASINFYGRSNFDEPLVIDVTGLTDETYYVSESLTLFDVDDFAGEDEVFGFVVFVNTSDNEYSQPSIIVKRTGLKSLDRSGELIVNASSLKKGVVSTIPFTLENNGTILSDYSFELSGSLSDYAVYDGNIQVLPDEIVDASIIVSVPRKCELSNGDLTVIVTAAGVVVANQTLSFNLTAADKVHSVIVDDIVMTKDYYFADEPIRGVILLSNDGDYTETFTVDYGFSNDELYRETVTLIAGAQKNVTLIAEAPESDSSDLIINLNNDAFELNESISVAVMDKDYSFRFYLDEAELISIDSMTENATLFVENTGNIRNAFIITTIGDVELADNSFVLNAGEIKEINAVINIPFNVESLNITFIGCSTRDDSCRQDGLLIDVFKTIDNSVDSDSIVNISETSLAAGINEGVIYSFDVTNNKLVARNYELNYSTDANITFSVYPSVEFVIQPGETTKVFLYATPSEAGNFNVSYVINEGGLSLANGTLNLVAGTGLEGLTGFAVAAGSVLGIAGLVVLVLFIYFYFIRQPPSGDDEFKPVEVKKADLTKPGVKNDNNKYW